MVFSSMAPFQFNYCHFSFSVSSVWRIEDFFILWYWKIWIVKHRSCQVTYRLTRRLKICALKFSPNEMSFRKWMCQMHWKIFSLNNVMRKFVKFFFFCRNSILFVQLFFSRAVRSKRICCFSRWEFNSIDSVLATHWYRLLWILRWDTWRTSK